ncbi:MAG: ABC transporter ATP-binding protein [Deltaproteobacteria bacterium]|jgi:putative ABC transport system ATP-binding protein|nr:ABC transporter ATP-binding protein [Deltaproteobacteria bacterium]
MNDILTATGLNKAFDNLQVVKDVSLTIQKGEFVCLVGKSGSGKTTLLSVLSGLEQPTSGEVTINGTSITNSLENDLALFRRKSIGFVFQSFNLIPTLSAWENVALPLFPVKMDREKRKERAMELLGQMEIDHRAEHRPSALSGGEKQRVAIARALVNYPEIIFADEPTGNLDSETSEAIMNILKHLHKQKGLSILMVSHDQELAASCDRIIHMKDGEVIS